MSQNNSRTNKDLERIIKSTAKDQVGDPDEDTPGWDKYYGYGRVDSFSALTYDSPPELQKKISNTKGAKKPTNTEADSKTKSRPSSPDN